MHMAYCGGCNRMTGFKRRVGAGTFLMVVISSVAWLGFTGVTAGVLVLPSFLCLVLFWGFLILGRPSRCSLCGMSKVPRPGPVGSYSQQAYQSPNPPIQVSENWRKAGVAVAVTLTGKLTPMQLFLRILLATALVGGVVTIWVASRDEPHHIPNSPAAVSAAFDVTSAPKVPAKHPPFRLYKSKVNEGTALIVAPSTSDADLAWIIHEGGRSEGLLCYKHVV
jgi:hypothetical protein